MGDKDFPIAGEAVPSKKNSKSGFFNVQASPVLRRGVFYQHPGPFGADPAFSRSCQGIAVDSCVQEE
jgi:hypothetical protein